MIFKHCVCKPASRPVMAECAHASVRYTFFYDSGACNATSSPSHLPSSCCEVACTKNRLYTK
jgi:hypothetical protein